MPASQEFRDGAAYGAAELAKRAVTVQVWGVKFDDGRLLHDMAGQIAYEMGGHFPQEGQS